MSGVRTADGPVMPRKHRSLQVPAGPDESLFHARRPDEARLEDAAEGLRRLGVLLGSDVLTPLQRQRLRTRWTRCLPQVARALAALLDGEPATFAPLPFDGPALRGGEARVRRLECLRAGLEGLLDRVCDLLLVEKAGLHGQVEVGLRALEALCKSPLTDPDVAARMRIAQVAGRGPAEGRRQAIRHKKRKSDALRARAPRRPVLAGTPAPARLPAPAAYAARDTDMASADVDELAPPEPAGPASMGNEGVPARAR